MAKTLKKKARAKPAPCRADIRVTFPDGCKHRQVTLPNVDIAADALKFAAWLHETADEIHDRATRMGRCHAKGDSGCE